ncbi:hypothetical protein JB92DRAFT_2806591 [Gautieria morchelliformis]|nr:hypothetical protein JB92DRAFT_2806591 [Gautieria morchelliformis]
MILDLNELSLFPATPAQVVACRTANHAHWGRGLDLQEYMGRADKLDIHEHATDGRLMTWVLVPRRNPQTLEFLSACETFRRHALAQDPASREPVETFAYGIAAVFCPPQHRRNGYPRHMLRLLHYVLASPGSLPPFPLEWGLPPVPPPGVQNACFSVLWSDIGPTYYETCGPSLEHRGWKLTGPVGTIWTTDPAATHPSDVRWLSEQDCVELWKQDALYLKECLMSSQLRGESSIRCTFLPDNGVAAFQLRRARFFLPALPDIPVPEKWGVIIPGVSPPTYATWITDIRPLPVALLITRIRASAETFPALLSAIMVAAKENAAATVEVWNLEQHLVEIAHKSNGITAQRAAEHLPALAWYGSGIADDVQWLFNEKCVLSNHSLYFDVNLVNL